MLAVLRDLQIKNTLIAKHTTHESLKPHIGIFMLLFSHAPSIVTGYLQMPMQRRISRTDDTNVVFESIVAIERPLSIGRIPLIYLAKIRVLFQFGKNSLPSSASSCLYCRKIGFAKSSLTLFRPASLNCSPLSNCSV